MRWENTISVTSTNVVFMNLWLNARPRGEYKTMTYWQKNG